MIPEPLAGEWFGRDLRDSVDAILALKSYTEKVVHAEQFFAIIATT
jgi:hypothetical protein